MRSQMTNEQSTTKIGCGLKTLFCVLGGLGLSRHVACQQLSCGQSYRARKNVSLRAESKWVLRALRQGWGGAGMFLGPLGCGLRNVGGTFLVFCVGAV